MPPFLLPIWLFFSPILEFWNKLPSSIKVLLLLILGILCGFIYGQHTANQKCEMQKQESIAEAQRIDRAANATAFKNMELDKEKYRISALDNENKLSEAAIAFQTLKKACSSDEDFIKRNNYIGNELDTKWLPKQVPSNKPRPTPNR